MGISFAVFAALLSGTGDFLGGLASRRASEWSVAAWNHAAGLVTVALLAPLLGGEITGTLVVWGSLAGVAGATGVLGLYAGFARSSLAVVSPIAAVGAAVWPVVWSLATGDVPGGVVLAGVAIGLVAIWLVSGGGGHAMAGDRSGLWFGMLAGLGFGAQLILFSFTSDGSNVWALVPARLVGGLTVAAVALSVGRSLRLPTDARVPGLAAGALTALGNGFFIIAAGLDSLAVVTVLAAMFPVATVLLARLVFHERLTSRRLIGLALALTAVALVSVG